MDGSSIGSSSSNPGGSTDLHVKYQTIATEYSKARAQLNILKKAVVEEQSRSAELKEAVRHFEQNGRKTEQEIDSLTFRNQQLTCRVTVLQDELDELQQNRNKKSKSKFSDGHHNSDITNHVIDEEFRKKIAENAELLSMMHEKEESHVAEVTSLKNQIDQLERRLEQAQKDNAETDEKHKMLVIKLEREKVALREGSEGLGSVSEELAQLQRTHAQFKSEMETRLSEATAIITNHLPSFVDNVNGEVNGLDNSCRLPELNRAPLPPRLVQLVWTEVSDAASALADFHRYSEIRLSHLPLAKSSPINAKYSLLLKECEELAIELENGLRDVAAGINDGTDEIKTALNRIPHLLANYCTKIETLMPLLRLSLEAEDEQITDDDIKTHTKNVVAKTSQFVSHTVQLNSVITLASKQKSLHQRQEQELINIFTSVVEDIKEMHEVYNCKFNKDLSSSNLSQEIREANSNTSTALSKLQDSTTKIVSGLKQLWQASKIVSKRQESLNPHFTKHAINYLNCFQTEEVKSLPYVEALKLLEDSKNELELKQGLQAQLDEVRSEVVKLDQEREHWKHEYNILKTKFEKDEISCQTYETGEAISLKETNMIGSIDAPFNIKLELNEREDKIKKYFLDRINFLIIEKQEAHSKAAAISTECSAITKRLEAALDQGKMGEIAIQELKEKIVQLQEELTTTASSYEAQLSTMSDHLATMNERLASQRETIDNLQYQINNKNSRKGKK